jgi:hypothetical protein
MVLKKMLGLFDDEKEEKDIMEHVRVQRMVVSGI